MSSDIFARLLVLGVWGVGSFVLTVHGTSCGFFLSSCVAAFFTAHPAGSVGTLGFSCASKHRPKAGFGMGGRRRLSVILRFCEYDLEELDSLVRAYGGFPRSSLVNIAIEEFLHSPRERDFQVCKKRKINLALRPDMLSKLDEYAKTYGVHRTDLIRLAIHNFKQKYGIKDGNLTNAE
jgi:metal-responsive CopG/Arc/MetJ family transcriptional regulator